MKPVSEWTAEQKFTVIAAVAGVVAVASQGDARVAAGIVGALATVAAVTGFGSEADVAAAPGPTDEEVAPPPPEDAPPVRATITPVQRAALAESVQTGRLKPNLANLSTNLGGAQLRLR